jgi:hypothetical protein
MGTLQRRVRGACHATHATTGMVCRAFHLPSLDQPLDAEGEGGTGWPEIVLVSFANEEISTDVIDVLGYERYRANDYLLAFSHPVGGLVGEGSPMVARTPGAPPFACILNLLIMPFNSSGPHTRCTWAGVAGARQAAPFASFVLYPLFN